MNARVVAGIAALCSLLLASCNAHNDSYQGWIEANLIFVAPDEAGRVQTLSVHEGDVVKAGDALFTVDDDLQVADLAQVKASLTNAQQTFDRASMLLKTGAGTQKDFDAAQAVLRDAQARLNSVQTRLSRRSVFSAVDGTVQQIYFRPGEMVSGGRPVLSLLPPGQHQGAVLCPAIGVADDSLRRRDKGQLRRLRQWADRTGKLHRQTVRVHAAGDLQPRGAGETRLPHRGAAGKAWCISRRPAG